MRKHFVFVVIGAMVIALSCTVHAQEGEIEVEDVGPVPNVPAEQKPFQGPQEVAQPDANQNADADSDGIPDSKDACPDTPRLIGMFDIGETFGLEDVELRYMGIFADNARLFQTTNIPAGEGGNLRCSIAAGTSGSCVIKGVPEVEIVLLEEVGNRVRILVRHRVDTTGCSPEI